MILRINNDIEIELISNYEAQTGVLNFVRGSSKVKTIAAVDVEKMNSIHEFVDYAVTENRLLQGVEYVFTQNNVQPDITRMGDFIRWIMNDVIKEEMQVMQESGLEPKAVGGFVSKKAAAWFKQYLMGV